jgi:hypothetical protein
MGHELKNGEISFTPHELSLSPFAPMNYQRYLRPLMNCHFATNNPIPLVKNVKRDGQWVTCVNSIVNSVVD